MEIGFSGSASKIALISCSSCHFLDLRHDAGDAEPGNVAVETHFVQQSALAIEDLGQQGASSSCSLM
eukprot:16427943-Heterocapsa_arctica.AAC.1